MSTIWNGFRRRKTPAGNRLAIQLTEGSATCYPLYYFIDTLSSDGRQLVHLFLVDISDVTDTAGIPAVE